MFAVAYRHHIFVEPSYGAALSLMYERKIDPHEHQKFIVIGGCCSGITREFMQGRITNTGILS